MMWQDVAKANQPMARFTTYRIGGRARWLAEVGSIDDLERISDFLRIEPLPVFVLGRGSNLVVSDAGVDGLVVMLGPSFSGVSFEGSRVMAGGATPLPVLAREAVKAGRGGLEWYVGIPGSVGGAIRMNAGGHGSETSACLIDAQVFDLNAGTMRTETSESLDFSYRSSSLNPADIVVTATFASTSVDPADASAAMREVSSWRREHQPGGTFNAGSVFTNPHHDSAGRLIDSLGLKGLRIGTAHVSHKHANFIEADPDGRSQDVYDLVLEVQARVLQETGITLVPEISFVGRFD
ncbi:MAG: UDP-N-acetylmuramate dehydrogenase [Acidimicrobiia bacterium]|nr:UDP-N-acetylmuramate dehydrogenase [Acidimicrobiia bacterium]